MRPHREGGKIGARPKGEHESEDALAPSSGRGAARKALYLRSEERQRRLAGHDPYAALKRIEAPRQRRRGVPGERYPQQPAVLHRLHLRHSNSSVSFAAQPHSLL
eukprot:scaffold434_cov186-Pinguiococcus_pyrenoidosus.AAC.144